MVASSCWSSRWTKRFGTFGRQPAAIGHLKPVGITRFAGGWSEVSTRERDAKANVEDKESRKRDILRRLDAVRNDAQHADEKAALQEDLDEDRVHLLVREGGAAVGYRRESSQCDGARNARLVPVQLPAGDERLV